MGYFNFFYKLTRIIDFFTRKRNRKFIIALCLIGAFVFFSPSTARAEFSSGDSYNLNQIYNKVNNIDFNCNYYFTKFNTYLDLSSGFLSTIRTDTGVIKEDVKIMQTDLQICESYLLQIMQDVDHIDDDMHDLLIKIDEVKTKLDNLQDTLDNIESILNSIGEDVEHYGELNHQDQEEIKQIIKDYLYGDAEYYALSFSQTRNMVASANGTFITNDGFITMYFKIKEGYDYVVYFNKLITENLDKHWIRFGFSDVLPRVGESHSTWNTWSTISYATEIGFTADSDKYFYMSYNPYAINSIYVESTYNQGQELGIYGGLTNIDSQVLEQGNETRTTIESESQNTRNTITNTDIPTNEMAIDTSIVGDVSNTENDNVLTNIINRFQGVISPSSSVTTITIPIPKTGKSIVLRSDLLSAHISNTIIGTYITIFWYVVFFWYFFKFAYRVINWVVTGEMIEKPSAFMKYLMEQNAIITASMM